MIARYKGKKYELKGKKCTLTGIKESDLPDFTKWFSDPEFYEHMATDFSSLNMKKERKWFEDTKKEKGIITFGIQVKEKGKNKVIGSVSLKNIDHFNEKALFGLAVADKKYWGKGIGTEATKLIVGFGFKVLKLNSMYLFVHYKNKAGQRVYEKAGFKKEGLLREHVRHNIPNKKEFDAAYYMNILKKDWKK